MGIHFMGVCLLWACISWAHSAGRWSLILSFLPWDHHVTGRRPTKPPARPEATPPVFGVIWHNHDT